MKKALLALLVMASCGPPDGMPPVGMRCLVTVEGARQIHGEVKAYEGPFLLLASWEDWPTIKGGNHRVRWSDIKTWSEYGK
jgi:hypothetical protein